MSDTTLMPGIVLNETGMPILEGTAVSVVAVLDLLAVGTPFLSIQDEHPAIGSSDIRLCIRYGAYVIREDFLRRTRKANAL